jgi:hypothetical protein
MLAVDSLPALVEVASALARNGRILDAGDCPEHRQDEEASVADA